MYVFFTERQSECPKLAADILRKIENHFARSARRIRIVKNREKGTATVPPLRNAGASLSAQRFGRNGDSSPIFHHVGCFWRHLLAPKGGRTRYKRIPASGISPGFPDRAYILRTFGFAPKVAKGQARRKRAGDGSVVRSAIFAVQNCRSARTRSMKRDF